MAGSMIIGIDFYMLSDWTGRYQYIISDSYGGSSAHQLFITAGPPSSDVFRMIRKRVDEWSDYRITGVVVLMRMNRSYNEYALLKKYLVGGGFSEYPNDPRIFSRGLAQGMEFMMNSIDQMLQKVLINVLSVAVRQNEISVSCLELGDGIAEELAVADVIYPICKDGPEIPGITMLQKAVNQCLHDAGIEKNKINYILYSEDKDQEYKPFQYRLRTDRKTLRDCPISLSSILQNLIPTAYIMDIGISGAARGGAVQGAKLCGKIDTKEILALNAAPKSLWISDSTGSKAERVLSRDYTLPAALKIVFFIHSPRDGKKTFAIYEGESSDMRKNKLLSVYEISGITVSRIDPVEIDFIALMHNAITLVDEKAIEKETGKEVKLRKIL